MKKGLALTLAFIFALLVSACGTDTTQDTESNAKESEKVAQESVEVKDTEETTTEETTTEETTTEETTTEETTLEANDASLEIGKTIRFDDFNFTLTGLYIVKDWDGNDLLKVTYDWENTSEESATPSFTFILKGFQDGVETDFPGISDDVDLGIGQKELKSGAKISAEDSIGITDISKPLELELSEMFSFDDVSYTLTIEDITTLN